MNENKRIAADNNSFKAILISQQQTYEGMIQAVETERIQFHQFFSEKMAECKKLQERLQVDLDLVQRYNSLPLAPQVHFLLIYICDFYVLNHLLLIYICKLHWNLNTMFVCQVNYFWFTYVISMS